MLSAEEKQEILAEMELYPNRQAATIDAMKIIQKHRGWVSDEALEDIADLLDLSVDNLDGVATFYNLIFRKPVGRHIILICDSITCWVMGYENLRDHIADRLGIQLGETTPDNRFTFLPIVCLGTCDHAPAMMIDADLHQDLTPEKVDEILARYE